MILKCCIIDDEPLAIELLESYVKRTPFLQLEASFNSAVQAVERVAQGDIDLIFLDIQMPELDGMEFSHMIDLRTVCRRQLQGQRHRLPAQAHRLCRFPQGGTKDTAMVRTVGG